MRICETAPADAAQIVETHLKAGKKGCRELVPFGIVCHPQRARRIYRE